MQKEDIPYTFFNKLMGDFTIGQKHLMVSLGFTSVIEAPRSASMADIVKNILFLVQTVIRNDKIMLKVEATDELPRINCRSQQIQRVLMNLLTDGRDALNEGYPGFDENLMTGAWMGRGRTMT